MAPPGHSQDLEPTWRGLALNSSAAPPERPMRNRMGRITPTGRETPPAGGRVGPARATSQENRSLPCWMPGPDLNLGRSITPMPGRCSSRCSNSGRATPRLDDKGRYCVPSPWGRDRANADQPSEVSKVQRQVMYRQLLDEQSARKAELLRRRNEEIAEIDKQSNASLSTRSHFWGRPDPDPNIQKGIVKDQLAAALYRKVKEKESRFKEQMQSRAWAIEADRDNAVRYHSERQKNAQVLEMLKSEWAAAAEEKRRLEKAQRDAELRAEREVVDELLVGMTPARRLRKPRAVDGVFSVGDPTIPYRAMKTAR
eukprot:TRINITY_DN24182_c1_g1_i1.p1 TRINITY_DN24182_c1_g1~~TRINITY_DN24182_c1_g1_i1.p1  ORF type:complete len:312 (+),score=51.60 TRINITY_DN24182_c1_g1_i1:141-1076(+)